MQLLHDVVNCFAHISGRKGAAGVRQQHTVVTQEAGDLQAGEHAAVGVDPGEQQGGDALLAQDAVEFVVPKAAEAVLEDGDVLRRDSQLVDDLRDKVEKMADGGGETARARLKAMAQTQDGFEIARRDLDIRGPGEFLGARQSGAPLLRFADLATDVELLAWARESAPLMLDRHNALAQRHILRWLGGKADYLKA